MQEPFIEAGRIPGMLIGERDVVTDVDNAAREVAERHDITTWPHANNHDQASTDQLTEGSNAAGVAATIPQEPDIGAQSIFTAARTRIVRDGVSAQGLSELIRALYLDETNFTFQTIAGLNAEDRALAERLIEAWLADPSAVEPWEEIYDTVRESHAVGRLREAGVGNTASFGAVI